jgi:hypothetical protein
MLIKEGNDENYSDADKEGISAGLQEPAAAEYPHRGPYGAVYPFPIYR